MMRLRKRNLKTERKNPDNQPDGMDKVIKELEDMVELKIGEKANSSDKSEEELRIVLKLIDELLELLPDVVIDILSKSDYFEIYERVLKRYGV